jgi:hypothetical protein
MSSIADDVLRTIERLASVLDSLGVRWAIGGSLSSSLHGEPRSTNDIDIIAELQLAHAHGFVTALGEQFYAVEEAVADAIRRHGSFNVIDDETVVKVDVFVPSAGPMGTGQLDRRQRIELTAELAVWILGPEDTVLQKLRWYEMGGSMSERQWRDICEVLRVQAAGIDLAYLRGVAKTRGLDSELERALAEVADAPREIE